MTDFRFANIVDKVPSRRRLLCSRFNKEHPVATVAAILLLLLKKAKQNKDIQRSATDCDAIRRLVKYTAKWKQG